MKLTIYGDVNTTASCSSSIGDGDGINSPVTSLHLPHYQGTIVRDLHSRLSHRIQDFAVVGPGDTGSSRSTIINCGGNDEIIFQVSIEDILLQCDWWD